jgi:hydroxypyruvate isomerase
MNRREFARTAAGTALGTALPASHLHAWRSDAAPAIKLSVMMWTVFRDYPFEERLERIAAAGYRAVELVDEFEKWSDRDYRRFNARKRSLGLTFDATAGVSKGIADPGGRDRFLSDLKTFLGVAEKLECPGVIILSGDRIGGLAHRVQHEACVEILKRAADVAFRQNVTLLLENIDPEESPEYFLTSAAEGLEIVREVEHPHIKFFYDFYHEQIAEGNLVEKLEKN